MRLARLAGQRVLIVPTDPRARLWLAMRLAVIPTLLTAIVLALVAVGAVLLVGR